MTALSRIELRHLRYFLAVADTLHFGRAAERLCMSQPPLSQAIQQLEDALGVAVFERHSRKVALTPAGQALLAPARQLLADLHAAIGAAQAAARGERGLLRVAYVGSAVFSVLPAIVGGTSWAASQTCAKRNHSRGIFARTSPASSSSPSFTTRFAPSGSM